MSKPPSSPEPSFGTRQMAFSFVVEMLGLVAHHVELAQRHADLEDLAGLTYASRRLVAHLKPALATLRDLHEEDCDAGR
jgi:hypothetical protein